MRFGSSHGKHHRHGHGFSLVELSVVVAIMSVVAVLGLEGAANFVNRTSSSITKERLVVLDDAVARFFKVYGRLPCPALRTGGGAASPTDDGYGLEDCSIGALPSTTLGGGLMSGAIPFRTLNLPMSLSLDGFGSKFNYVVTKNLTVAGTATGQFGFYDPNDMAVSGIGGIEMRTGILGQPCGAATCQIVANPTPAGYPADGVLNPFPDGAVYVIFSAGIDKRGAVSAAGVSLSDCIPPPTASYDARVDSQNCVQGDNAISIHITTHLGGFAIDNNVFYDSRYNTGFVEDNHFDDLVIWRKRGQL